MAMRKKFEPALKARIALEAVRGEKTLAELSSEYGVHGTQISKWKQELIQRSGEIFAKPDSSFLYSFQAFNPQHLTKALLILLLPLFH